MSGVTSSGGTWPPSPELFPVGAHVVIVDTFAHPAAGEVGQVVESFAPQEGRNVRTDGGALVNVSTRELSWHWAVGEDEGGELAAEVEASGVEVIQTRPLCERDAAHGGTEAVVWTRAGWVSMCAACARDELAGML